MPASLAQRSRTPDYASHVEREEELARLRNQVQDHAKAGKSMLVFGPAGVGKSRLLQVFVARQPRAIYVAQMRSPRELLLALIQGLHSVDMGRR